MARLKPIGESENTTRFVSACAKHAKVLNFPGHKKALHSMLKTRGPSMVHQKSAFPGDAHSIQAVFSDIVAVPLH